MAGVAGSPVKSKRSAVMAAAVLCCRPVATPTLRAPVRALRPRGITAATATGMLLIRCSVIWFVFLWFGFCAAPPGAITRRLGAVRFLAKLAQIGNAPPGNENPELFTFVSQVTQ